MTVLQMMDYLERNFREGRVIPAFYLVENEFDLMVEEIRETYRRFEELPKHIDEVLLTGPGGITAIRKLELQIPGRDGWEDLYVNRD